ncbi:MAG: hypothetical protein RLZZ324_668 [Candidatus Parcubacteria bacterium]|jgi:hypothetical protein
MHSGLLLGANRAITARIRLFLVAALAVTGFALAPMAANAAATDDVWGWAWSGTIGWISMNCTDITGCAASNYGVNIADHAGSPGVADVTGYAWSETMGWICFGTTCTGPTPEGGAPYAQYRQTNNGKTDQFWGWAQVISQGANGWLALNCDKDVGADDCATSNYYVGFNQSTGVFNPGGLNDHWAWSGNSDGTGIGWVDMSGVNSSWILASLGTIRRPSGVYEPLSQGGVCVSDANCTVAPWYSCNTGIGKCVLPGTHLSAFPITFTGFSATSGQYLACSILLPDASRRVVGKTLSYASGRIVSGVETLNYSVQPGDNIQQNSLWYVAGCTLAGAPNATACASDAICGASAICDTTLGKCRGAVATSANIKPIFAHANTWTGLGASQDQYQAIKCAAGFPDNYFKNAAVCDFTSDASFALSMRRGIPVEGNCTDGIDNDGNGQIDCADRYCQGISYLCPGATLPRATCTYGQSGDNLIDCSDPAYASGQLCCTQQPVSAGATQSHIVDGLECTLGDPKDGYYDCSCVNAAAYNASTTDDCFAPGAQTGDLCCDSAGNVVKK